MKKIIAIFAILACALFCINVKAEENYVEYFEGKSKNIHWWTLYDGLNFFGENENPTTEIILNYITYTGEEYFADYAEFENCIDEETQEEYRCGATFNVPQDIFEDTLKRIFNIDDDFIAKNIRTQNSLSMGNFELKLSGDNGVYYFEPQYGWGTAPSLEISFIGYKSLGDNTYEIYNYLVDYRADYWEDAETGEYGFYKPTKNDVLGRDYIIDYYSYTNENGEKEEVYNVVKVVGYTKATIVYDGEFVKYLSYEEIEEKDMPKFSELIVKKAPALSAEYNDINITAPEGTFIEGTKIAAEPQTEGKIFDVASKALKEKFTSFVIYEINAKAGEYDVEPNGKVEISIKVPEGYQTPVIYYVSEDGKLEKLETKVEEGYAVAYVEHFSTYAIVDEKVTIAEKIDKVVENVVENPKTGIISGVGIVAVAGGCGAYFYNKNKKKNKFPNS